MKNALIVGMNSTEERTGGGNGALHSSLAFHAAFHEYRIHYFGIASAFWKQRAHHYHEVPRSRWDDVISRARLRTNFLCLHIDAYLSQFGYRFDVVLLGNSRLGYIAAALRGRTRLLITYYANIETDYIRHKYGAPVLSWVDGKLFRLRERQCAALTDLSLFLTRRDQERHAQLYGHGRYLIFPMATPARDVLKKKASELRLAFLGSLSYRPNVRAVRYIASEILPSTSYRLLLAGSSPCAEVKALVRAHAQRIEFHPDFPTLDGIVSDQDVFLSPLADGAGMKVKVADCISMGAPILGTSETFVGYERLPHVSYLTCRTREDYLVKLRELSDPARYRSIAHDLYASWKREFSLDASTSTFVSACAQLLTSRDGSRPTTLGDRGLEPD